MRSYQELYLSLCGVVPDSWKYTRMDFKKLCNKAARYDELREHIMQECENEINSATNISVFRKLKAKIESLDEKRFVKGNGNIRRREA